MQGKPNLPACHLCGRQFGTSSLKIHQKSCAERYERERGRAAPKAPESPFAGGGGEERPLKPGPDAARAIDEYNDAAYEAWAGDLEPCSFCSRKFLPDRLAVHMRGCNKRGGGSGGDSDAALGSKKAEKSGGGGRQTLPVCYLCGREFGTASLQIHIKACKEKYERERGKPAPEPPEAPTSGADDDRPLKPSAKEWAECNEAAWASAQSQLDKCPNCARTFAPDRLLVHLRSCRPKEAELSADERKVAEKVVELLQAASAKVTHTPAPTHASHAARRTLSARTNGARARLTVTCVRARADAAETRAQPEKALSARGSTSKAKSTKSRTAKTSRAGGATSERLAVAPGSSAVAQRRWELAAAMELDPKQHQAIEAAKARAHAAAAAKEASAEADSTEGDGAVAGVLVDVSDAPAVDGHEGGDGSAHTIPFVPPSSSVLSSQRAKGEKASPSTSASDRSSAHASVSGKDGTKAKSSRRSGSPRRTPRSAKSVASAGGEKAEAQSTKEKAAAPAPPAGKGYVLTARERLVQLNELLDAGLVTSEEHTAKRAQILQSL